MQMDLKGGLSKEECFAFLASFARDQIASPRTFPMTFLCNQAGDQERNQQRPVNRIW
jgi:hypothetical protein